MNKFFLSALVGILMFFAVAANVSAHCEIPCGIYDDAMRIKMVAEHITTVEKSMKQVIALEKNKQANMNQLVRWVTNKEKHADEIQHIVAQYFMTQRIKLGAKEYQKKIGLLHQMLIYSMKCKQTTDLANVGKLRDALEKFRTIYFETK
jgi:nickel superoxide dismutase